MSGAVALPSVTARARAYLQALNWDGRRRLTNAATDILGASRRGLASIYLARTVVGAVARAFQPGCTLGSVLVLCGDGGEGKTSFLRMLAGAERFGTWSASRGVHALQDAWIVEVPDLDEHVLADRRATFRSMLAAQTDDPHIADPLHQRCARPSIAIGTSNAPSFWLDGAAGRFWPIQVGIRIDLGRLEEQREQLWAEAVALYRNGERWWLDTQAGAA